MLTPRSLKFGLLSILPFIALSCGQLPRAYADEAVTLGNLAVINKGLVGVGRLPSDLRDKFGETVGSGSALTADPKSWTRTGNTYHGIFYLLPDRGYNVIGTTDFRARLYKLSVDFNPPADPAAMADEARQHSVGITLDDTMLLTDAAGKPLTGLDPQDGLRAPADGFPEMPQAATGSISADTEGLVLMADGSYFVSDEYGPYIYRFSAEGRMLAAIRPPDAFIPRRKGQDNFSSNNPGPGAPAPEPKNPDTGRQNNQGFEGLSLTPDGKFLVAALQSATRQDGGTSPKTREYTRILYYDISNIDHPMLAREYVVPLPVFNNANGKRRIAAQSEILALDETHFLLLCRDTGNGYGLKGATSAYRKIELLDTSKATNIAGSKFDGLVPVAPKGQLDKTVVSATRTTFIDINDNRELNRFGLHNGEPNDTNDLYEKWEGMALLPALDPANPNDFLLFVSNDNDFVTQNGFQIGAAYKDESGANVDTMLLVYRLTLPSGRQ